MDWSWFPAGAHYPIDGGSNPLPASNIKFNMALTIKDLQAKMAPYKGTLVLDYFDVVLLYDVTYDDDDFYWVYKTKKGEYHSSCVGTWRPLKGFIKDKDYQELVRVWNLNHQIQAI